MQRGGVFAALAVASIFLSVFTGWAAGECSRKCVAENCNSLAIRYGKFCGAGWTACPGEKPCDDVDNCCRIHDNCVGIKGYSSVKCHRQFKKCINQVLISGKQGFSRTCPYKVAVPTMARGMAMAIFFGQFAG